MPSVRRRQRPCPNAATGAFAGTEIAGTDAGDIFMQAQFPLHSGRIIGIPGRILMSILGVVIAGLSAMGIVIWSRKRALRRLAQAERDDGPESDQAALTT